MAKTSCVEATSPETEFNLSSAIIKEGLKLEYEKNWPKFVGETMPKLVAKYVTPNTKVIWLPEPNIQEILAIKRCGINLANLQIYVILLVSRYAAILAAPYPLPDTPLAVATFLLNLGVRKIRNFLTAIDHGAKYVIFQLEIKVKTPDDLPKEELAEIMLMRNLKKFFVTKGDATGNLFKVNFAFAFHRSNPKWRTLLISDGSALKIMVDVKLGSTAPTVTELVIDATKAPDYDFMVKVGKRALHNNSVASLAFLQHVKQKFGKNFGKRHSV